MDLFFLLAVSLKAEGRCPYCGQSLAMFIASWDGYHEDLTDHVVVGGEGVEQGDGVPGEGRGTSDQPRCCWAASNTGGCTLWRHTNVLDRLFSAISYA